MIASVYGQYATWLVPAFTIITLLGIGIWHELKGKK